MLTRISSVPVLQVSQIWLIVLLPLLWGQARASLLFLFLFLCGCPCLSWSTTLRQPWNPGCSYWTFQTRGFQLFFSGFHLCQFLIFTIQVLFQPPPNFSLYLIPLVHKIMHPIRHPFPFLFSILCLLGQADMLLMQPLDFSHHLLKLCSKGSGHAFKNWSTQDSRGRGLARLQEGDWYQYRNSPKLGQEFLLPELFAPPLAGVFILETPIEHHCDPKNISTFCGGYFIGL